MSDLMDKNSQDIIKGHRKALIVSGNLSDFQLENLKKWPFLLYDNLKEVTIDYNFSCNDDDGNNTFAGEICFDLSFEGKGVDSSVKVSSPKELLSLWTKFLFWEGTEVSFKKEGVKWI